MKHASLCAHRGLRMPGLRFAGLLLASLALASATCHAQLPSEMRTAIDLSQSDTKPAQVAFTGSGFKLDTATIFCSAHRLNKQQVKVTMHGQVLNAELRLTLGGSPAGGSPWPMPNAAGNQISFTSPAVTLTPGATYTVVTYPVGNPNPTPSYIKTVVAPSCSIERSPVDKNVFTPNPQLP